MRKIDNKGFFLAETIVVVTIVATVLVLFYSQISKIYHNYENNSSYNTSTALHSANNIKKFLVQEDLATAVSALTAVAPASIVDITNYTFTNADYFTGLKTSTNVRKIYFAKFQLNNLINGIEASTLDAATFDFIKTLKTINNPVATNKYYLIVSFTDGTFASLVIDTNDTVKPVITLIGNDEISFNASLSTYTDLGATAIDDVDGTITADITSVNTVVPNTPGSYTVTYSVTDAAGNTATKVRKVNVFYYTTDYNYSGTYKAYTVPHTGNYKIDLWGAQGGGTYGTGLGGYTSGVAPFVKGETLYFYVGNKVDTTNTTSFNGGVGSSGGYPGGGATDVRLVKKYRYIRDYINGSTSSTNNNWIEIMAFIADGTNVALNKTVTGSYDISNGHYANDGITNVISSYATMLPSSVSQRYIEIDLGAEYAITSVAIYHYYNDGRTYYNNKVELINEAKTENLVVFNGELATGTQVNYAETAAGKTYNIGLRDRIMVAAGGGSGTTAGAGGNLTGQNGVGSGAGTAGTQTAGGAGYGGGGFGYGGGGCGGGSGYYGGGGGTCATGGGGGSSFISGYTGVDAVDAQGQHTGEIEHYSGKVFTSTAMYNGDQAMPGPTGVSEQGHAGNGWARITYLP
ncbi:MAG: glycine-rich protein [Bacilli bacterium]|nr:glycine-rich protein [Bacilli bacterium]